MKIPHFSISTYAHLQTIKLHRRMFSKNKFSFIIYLSSFCSEIMSNTSVFQKLDIAIAQHVAARLIDEKLQNEQERILFTIKMSFAKIFKSIILFTDMSPRHFTKCIAYLCLLLEYWIDENPYPYGARSKYVKVGQVHRDDCAVEVGVPLGHLDVSLPLPYRMGFSLVFLIMYLFFDIFIHRGKLTDILFMLFLFQISIEF